VVCTHVYLMEVKGIRHPGIVELNDAYRTAPHSALLSSVGGDVDILRSMWNIYETSLTYGQVCRAFDEHGARLIMVPMAYLSRAACVGTGLWSAEVALEIAARFVPPIGVLLTCVDVLRSLPSVITALKNRVQLHTDFFADGRRRATVVESTPFVLNQTITANRRTEYDSEGRPIEIVEQATFEESIEGGPTSSTVSHVASVAGTGLAYAVGVPVGTGLALAGVGVTAGLVLAASPFAAGYAAYKRAKGETISMPQLGWRKWGNPMARSSNLAVSTHVDRGTTEVPTSPTSEGQGPEIIEMDENGDPL
jgi:hypothetical protein